MQVFHALKVVAVDDDVIRQDGRYDRLLAFGGLHDYALFLGRGHGLSICVEVFYCQIRGGAGLRRGRLIRSLGLSLALLD